MPPAKTAATETDEDVKIGDPEADEAFDTEMTEAVTADLDEEETTPEPDEVEESDAETAEIARGLDDEQPEEPEPEKEEPPGEADKPAETTEATEEVASSVAAPGPSWADLSVTADKENVAIPEAKVAEVGDHMMLAVPKAEYGRFQQRLAMGVVGQKMWRQLNEGLREVQSMREAPGPKSDAQIEADLTLEVLKPFLPEILDAKDLQVLELRIKDAQRTEKDRYAKEEAARQTALREPPWEETQSRGIADTMIGLVRANPELNVLTKEDVEAVYHEVLPVRNSLYYREGPQTFANTEYLLTRLKARAASRSAPAQPVTSAPTPAPAKAATPGPTASPAKGKTVPDKADRFNRGVDAGVKSTSVKANRTARPAKAPTRDRDRQPALVGAEARAQAEDQYRKTTRNYLASNSLDFGGEDED